MASSKQWRRRRRVSLTPPARPHARQPAAVPTAWPAPRSSYRDGLTRAAQAGARLISPFPGRIKDWVSANGGEPDYAPEADPGVVEVGRMYAYYKAYGHEGTICMPASWRPSRGKSDPAFMIDEIVALAGVDRMTIPPPLLELLAGTDAPLPRKLEPEAAKAACADPLVGGGDVSESAFRLALNADVCATTKMAEGINAFVAETLKLEAALKAKL